MPAGCYVDLIQVWENSLAPYPYTNIDPYVTISNITYKSPTETDFTVTVAANAPTEYDAVNIECYGGCGLVNDFRTGVLIQPPAPPACPIPAITAVTPGIWFAGKTYNKVTITGSGFTNTESCPAPQINMYDVNGNQIPFSNVKVTSATEMIAHKVAPPADTPTETVCVSEGARVGPQVVSRFAGTGASAAQVPGTTGSPCTDPYGNSGITVQILGAPKILCSGNDMQCNGKRISVIDDGSGTEPAAQQAVVGQQIKLKTKPTADKLATLGLAFSENKWKVDGTNIGTFKLGPAASNGSPSTASVTPTVLKKADLTTYWLYPTPSGSSSFPVKYHYCVNIPGLSADDIANGLNCSLEAKAAFNVTGPTAQITPYQSTSDTSYLTWGWWVSTAYTGCAQNPGEPTQMLVFGMYAAPGTDCTTSVQFDGIVFAATNVNTAGVTTPSGTFWWVQLITGGQITGTLAVGGSAPAYPLGTGLDNRFPAYTGTTAQDAPSSQLVNTWAYQSETFSAQMYLMWYSNLDPAAIPVPIGYETWSINGSAYNGTGSPPWFLAPSSANSTATTSYTASTAQQPSYGMPTWTNVLINSGTLELPTSKSESNESDGEKENQQ